MFLTLMLELICLIIDLFLLIVIGAIIFFVVLTVGILIAVGQDKTNRVAKFAKQLIDNLKKYW